MWSPIVRQIRGLWYKCAQSSGNVETAAKLLLEMMSPSKLTFFLSTSKANDQKVVLKEMIGLGYRMISCLC